MRERGQAKTNGILAILVVLGILDCLDFPDFRALLFLRSIRLPLERLLHLGIHLLALGNPALLLILLRLVRPITLALGYPDFLDILDNLVFLVRLVFLDCLGIHLVGLDIPDYLENLVRHLCFLALL